MQVGMQRVPASAFNARHIISEQRNNMYPETVKALAVVFKGYKNNIV